MSTGTRAFSARVQLPCRVFCGPDSVLELSGVAKSIDTSNLTLELPSNGAVDSQKPHPAMGEQVRLELTLPSPPENAHPKCLAVRARVTQITEMQDGSREVTLSFRKASFKDRVEGVLPKPPKSTGSKSGTKAWRM